MDATANVVAAPLETELQAFRGSFILPRLKTYVLEQLSALLATADEDWTNEHVFGALEVCADTLMRSRRHDRSNKSDEYEEIESVLGCPANGAFFSLVLFPEAPARDTPSFKKSLQIPLQACLAESSLLTFDGKHPCRKASIPTPPIDDPLAAEPSASAQPQDPKATSVWGQSGTSGAAKLFNGSASALGGQAAPAPAVPAPSPAHQAPAIRKSGGAQRPTFEPEICTLFVSGIPESWDLGKICKEHLGIRTLRVNLIPPRVANPGRKLNTVRFFSRSDALKALGALNELRAKECPSLLAKVAERDMEVNPRQRASARGNHKSTGPAKSPAKPSAAAQTGAMPVDALPADTAKSGGSTIYRPANSDAQQSAPKASVETASPSTAAAANSVSDPVTMQALHELLHNFMKGVDEKIHHGFNEALRVVQAQQQYTPSQDLSDPTSQDPTPPVLSATEVDKLRRDEDRKKERAEHELRSRGGEQAEQSTRESRDRSRTPPLKARID